MANQSVIERFPGVFLWFPQLSNIGHCTIGIGTVVHSHVWIGDGVIIGKKCFIEAFTFIPKGVTIEDEVFLGPRVTFTNDLRPPSFGKFWKNTLVKKRASLGAGVVVLPGVTIGEGAIVGAGAVVTKDIPPGETWVGVPAKKIKKETD